MIELRGVVAAHGLRPITAMLRDGEVVRLDGSPAATAAIMEVIARRRAPLAGAVIGHDAGPAVLVRAGERLPSALDPRAALALWASLAGARAAAKVDLPRVLPSDPDAQAASRGSMHRRPVWLVDGTPGGAAAIARAAADAVRGGDGVMLVDRTSDIAADRTIAIEGDRERDGEDAGERDAMPSSAESASPRKRRTPTVSERWTCMRWGAIARFALAAARAPAAIAVAVVAALWLAAWTAAVGAHEGFWYDAGSADALGWIARFGGMGPIAAVAVVAAARARAAPAWPALLRETGAGPIARAATLIAADAGASLGAALVAALPAVWLARGPASAADAIASALLAIVATLIAASAAGAIERVGRVPAGLGALVGAAVGFALVW